MCKSHTKKIGALKLSQQDVGKNCIFRGCERKQKENKKENERAGLDVLYFYDTILVLIFLITGFFMIFILL